MLDDSSKIEFINTGLFYIMTSYREWDNVTDNSSYYFRHQINYLINHCVNNTQTIFLKISKTSREIEKAWIGKIFSIKALDMGVAVNFSFQIDKLIKIVPEFRPLEIGWYIIKSQNDLEKLKPEKSFK